MVSKLDSNNFQRKVSPKNGVAKHERLFYLTPNTIGSHLDYIYNAALHIWTSQNKTL